MLLLEPLLTKITRRVKIFLKNGFPEGIGKTCWFQAGQICVYRAVEEAYYL